MAEEGRNQATPDQAARPLDELCDEILVQHHAYAHVAVPRIRGHLASVVEREPDALPAALPEAFAQLADLLLNHLAKEENILFPPWLRWLKPSAPAGGGRRCRLRQCCTRFA